MLSYQHNGNKLVKLLSAKFLSWRANNAVVKQRSVLRAQGKYHEVVRVQGRDTFLQLINYRQCWISIGAVQWWDIVLKHILINKNGTERSYIRLIKSETKSWSSFLSMNSMNQEWLRRLKQVINVWKFPVDTDPHKANSRETWFRIEWSPLQPYKFDKDSRDWFVYVCLMIMDWASDYEANIRVENG